MESFGDPFIGDPEMLVLQLQNANAKRSPYFLELRHNILFPDLERLIDVTDLNTELFMMLMILTALEIQARKSQLKDSFVKEWLTVRPLFY